MEQNFTIHIFGYGETQINSKEFSIKVKTNVLQTANTLITEIFNKKPAQSNSTENYHAINIFNYQKIHYISKEGFVLKNPNELKEFIDALISELKAIFEQQQNP